MGNRIAAPRNFNTVRRSNRDIRLLRQKKAKMVLLAICIVLLLLLLVSTVFLFCHTAYLISKTEVPATAAAMRFWQN